MKKSIKTLLTAIVVTSASCIFNPLTTDAYAKIDSYLPQPESGWTRYDDASPYIKYDGYGWNDINYFEYYKGSQTQTPDTGDSINFNFKGSKFRIIAETALAARDMKQDDPEYTIMEVYVDGKRVGAFDEMVAHIDENSRQNLVYEYDTNKNSIHEVKIVKFKDGYNFRLDAIDVNGSMTFDDATSNPSPTKKEPKMWIESPVNSSSIHDENLNIDGWALNDSGINHINIYLDDKYIGKTTVKYPRTDVTNTFKNYKDSENAGFSYKYSANKLSSGSHKVKVTVVGNDGSEQSQERYFNINRKEPKLWIESPNNGQKVKNKIEIAGWTLNDSGVDYLNLYIDGKFVGKTTAKYERYDIVNTFKDYIDGIHSGFSYNYDVSKLTKGSHVLKVTSVGNDGSTISQERRFIIDRNESKMWIESPNSDEKVTNKLRVGGWALNDSGIKNINVYVDNQFIGSTTAKYDRTDIANAFPSYSNPLKSGFLYDLNLSKYSNGKHIIKVVVIGNDGTEHAQARTIYK